MENDYQIFGMERVQLTDAEQAEVDARRKETEDNAPSLRMMQLRRRRNELLVETDYMGNSDVTMSDSWKTYRQALRDITKQTPSDDALSNITFPTKPS
tara:strand:- start:27 stop:320 length:294 start_codon:yes stop_codon:yes gene_type:complete